MITLHDLETAIARCQGESDPDAKTCIKLAAYYTIKEAMFGDTPAHIAETPSYSYAPPPASESVVSYQSGTRFSEAIDGLPAVDVWAVMDELMTVLGATNQRLYDGVMRELGKI